MRFPSATRDLPAEPVVAVVGATGLVGQVLLEVLAAREFPLGELRALAGPSGEAREVTFRGRRHPVREADGDALEGADLVFFAATGELSRRLAPEAVRRGARVVDKSATWRADPEVPLIVPEVNGEELAADASMVACPNCTTIGLVLALEPLRRAAGLERVVVTTLQAASGAGREGLRELEQQEWALARSEGVQDAGPVFPGPLARNALPLCGTEGADGSSSEELRLLYESRRLLGLPDLELQASCARVPVPVGHLASIWLETERPLSAEAAREVLAAFPGLRLVELPTPAAVAGGDEVLVGRVRVPAGGGGLALWQVADNLRVGAATNAVRIAEGWLGST